MRNALVKNVRLLFCDACVRITWLLDGKGFLQAKGIDERSQYTMRVSRVIEGHEPIEFRSLFQHWSCDGSPGSAPGDPAPPPPTAAASTSAVSLLSKNLSLTSIAKSTPTSFDATSLLAANPQLAAETQLVDDGKSPHKRVWCVYQGDLHELAESYYGEFHSADCYLVHYKYFVGRAQKHILYFWIVRWLISLFSRLDSEMTPTLCWSRAASRAKMTKQQW